MARCHVTFFEEGCVRKGEREIERECVGGARVGRREEEREKGRSRAEQIGRGRGWRRERDHV